MKDLWKLLICFVFVSISSFPAKAETLAGSEWGLVGHPERFIQFEIGGRVSGFAGCNRFFGAMKVQTNRIRFSPLGTTKKLCSKKVMLAERTFLTVLERTRSFERKTGVLILMGVNEIKLLSLRQRDWD